MDEEVKLWTWSNSSRKVHGSPNTNTDTWLPIVLEVWLVMTPESCGSPLAVITQCWSQLMVGNNTPLQHSTCWCSKHFFFCIHPCPPLCSPNKVLHEAIIRKQLNCLGCCCTKHPQPCCHFEVCSVAKELFQPWIIVDLGRGRRTRLAFLI